jgi:hypothetical protein
VRPGIADPLGQLAFIIRWERDETGDLPHCHILISRFPERLDSIRIRALQPVEAAFQSPKGLHSERDCVGRCKTVGPLEVRQAYLLRVRMVPEVVCKSSVCRGK